MDNRIDNDTVKEILAGRDTMLIRPKRISNIVDEIIGDDLIARGKLFTALINYDPYESIPMFTQDELQMRQAWALIQLDLDEDIKKYVSKMIQHKIYKKP